MNVQQKVAWYNLGVFAVAALAYLALVPLLGFLHALAAYGLLGLWGLSPLFFRRSKGGVLIDERDQLVGMRAQLAGLWIFWLCFVAACIIPWAVLHYHSHRETVTIDVLPWMAGGAMVVFTVTHSIAVLLQYRMGRAHESA